jgi:glycosyltransferase involved in cell wall biosynthesis
MKVAEEQSEINRMTGRRILFVGMQSSPHAARWIELVTVEGWDLHFFPVDGCMPDPRLQGVTLHWPVLDPAIERKNRPDVIMPGIEPSFSFARRLARIGRLMLRDPLEGGRRVRARLVATGGPNLLTLGLFGAKENSISTHSSRGAHNETSAPLRWSRFTPTLEELGGAAAVEAQSVRLGESQCAAPILNGPGILAERIRTLRPDLIHSMEFQHSAYLVLRAREQYGAGFPTWLATNWGSDIFYFGQFVDHRAQIERVLAAIDFYSCECERDIAIARKFGYSGPAVSGIPNSGGFDLKQVTSLRSPQPASRRKVVMVKGYQHFAGRALTALKVLERFAPQLKDYRIILFSVSDEPRRRALALQQAKVLDIHVIDWAPHEQILRHFGEARIYMGISISDAISTSVLEAMAMGAFPIQTNTSCCDEWFKDGEGGFIVPPDDFNAICEKFDHAMKDDALVDRAAEVNWRTVKMRLDNNIIGPRIIDFYHRIFAQLRTAS